MFRTKRSDRWVQTPKPAAEANWHESLALWKNRCIKYLKTTSVSNFLQTNLFTPWSSLKTDYPAIHAVAMAVLSILLAVLMFKPAFEAISYIASFKQIINIVAPIAFLVLYSQILLSTWQRIKQAKQEISQLYNSSPQAEKV